MYTYVHAANVQRPSKSAARNLTPFAADPRLAKRPAELVLGCHVGWLGMGRAACSEEGALNFRAATIAK